MTTCSTVCTSVPHSQAADGDIPHLCKQERKPSTPVRRRLSRSHAILGRAVQGGWVPTSGMKLQSLVVFSNQSVIRSERSTFVIVVRWTGELLCGGYRWVSQLKMLCILTRVVRWGLSGTGVQAPWQACYEKAWLLCDEAQWVSCPPG